MRYGTWLTSAAVASAALLAVSSSNPVEASHFRGGNIYWTPGAGNTINFTVTTYFRRSYPFWTAPNVGDTVTADVNFDFGDGSPQPALSGSVFSVNLASDWFGMASTFVHTYASASTFTADVESCCRLSTLQNNSDDSYRIQSTVTVGGGDSSPNTGGSSPIFLVPDGGIQMFNPFFLTDPDGGPHVFTLATPAQAGDATHVPPTGLTVNPVTGEVTWDTDLAGADPGELWNVSFLVTDGTGNTAPLDILLQVCTTGDPGCGAFEEPDSAPEPGTLSLLALGLLGTAGLVRRRRRKA